MSRRSYGPRNRPLGACLALGIAAAAGCAGVPRSAVTPEVELVGLDVRGSGVDGQQFALTLLVSNPNSEPIPVAEIRYSVRLAGEGYLNGRSTTPIVLAAAGRQTVRIELASDSVSSGSRLLALARGPANTLAYILTGDLVLTGRPPRLLPFTYSGDVPLTIAAGD